MRLTGAALYSKVIKLARQELADYGFPMDEYSGQVVDIYDLGSDMQPIMDADDILATPGLYEAVVVTTPGESDDSDDGCRWAVARKLDE